jgi:hypothetical protein
VHGRQNELSLDSLILSNSKGSSRKLLSNRFVARDGNGVFDAGVMSLVSSLFLRSSTFFSADDFYFESRTEAPGLHKAVSPLLVSDLPAFHSFISLSPHLASS